jgi:hypothetical protein
MVHAAFHARKAAQVRSADRAGHCRDRVGVATQQDRLADHLFVRISSQREARDRRHRRRGLLDPDIEQRQIAWVSGPHGTSAHRNLRPIVAHSEQRPHSFFT